MKLKVSHTTPIIKEYLDVYYYSNSRTHEAHDIINPKWEVGNLKH